MFNIEKAEILVLFDFDDDGYIHGYQQEFDDGRGNWQTPFDPTDAIQMDPAALTDVIIGASKLIDGKVVVDQDKLAELQAASAPQPTSEQQMINTLGLQNAQLVAKVTELEKKLGGES